MGEGFGESQAIEPGESYFDNFMVAIVRTILALIAVMVLGTLFGSF